jgi:hypothetical protein
VIIIGAGIAGLAAAKTLIDNGLQDIKILEGEQNISDLLKSSYFEGQYFLCYQLFQFISVHSILLRSLLIPLFHLPWSKEFFQTFLYQILYLFLIFSHICCISTLSQSCFHNVPHISIYIINQAECSKIIILYILIFGFVESG